MNVKELYRYLDLKIPSSLSCDWDNDGLMCCPDSKREVKKVLITLDITERAVKYAVDGKFDLIISHHPLIFKKIRSFDVEEAPSRKLLELIKNDISAFSFHTRLDALEGGVNDVLAEKLHLKEIRPFGPEGEKMGRIGVLDKEVTLKEFCSQIKNTLSSPMVLFADSGRKVKKVALLGGDGKDFVAAAISEGADTYLSGRISYNIMAEASETGINLIEAGHFFTENPVCKMMEVLIKEAVCGVETEIFCSNEIKVI